MACNKRAVVISDNTEVFLLYYKDLEGNFVDPTAIELTFSDTYTGKVFFSGDVTTTVQREGVGFYKYFYQIPLDCDNLQIETKATIDNMTFVDRAVAKVIDSRPIKYPDGNPR